MTHHTDAERAEFERTVADGMYGGLIGLISDHWDSVKGEYKLFQHQVAWIAWKAARRAPAAPVPQEPTSKQVVLGAGALLGQPENTADNRHPDWHTAVEKARSVYLAMLAAAPQPPEAGCSVSNGETQAAPVQLPEPVAKIEGGSLKWHIPDAGYSLPLRYLQGTQMLYTEQQVRDLLAAAKVERDPLTDSEIESATGAKQGTPLFLAAKGFAIAIERAHGIGKDKA